MGAGAALQILPANNMGDPLSRIIDDYGQMVAVSDILASDDDIVRDRCRV